MSAPTPQDIFTNFLALAPIIAGNDQQELRIENDAGGKILYVGRTTIPNAATSDTVWALVKYYYDGYGFLSRLQQPDDGAGLKYSWDQRSTYFS